MKNVLWLVFLILPSWTYAQDEKIERFHADIRLNPNGTLEVREEIHYTTKISGKRGIVRSLPLERTTSDGQTRRSKPKIRSIKKDQTDSPYHTENQGGSLTIYVGEKSVFLEPGTYQYEITYTISDQTEFFESFDELNWNVNGTNWDFSMDEVSATLQLPEGVEIIQSACYTGVYGSQESNCQVENQGNRSYVKAQNLGSRENLSIAVGFTKGVVAPPPPPTAIQRYGFPFLIIFIGGILLFYYAFTWKKFGVDPPKPTVIPRFNPPRDLSPASVSILSKGYYAQDMITPAIINLAAKGYVKISDESKSYVFGVFKTKKFIITQEKPADASLPSEERVIHEALFLEENHITLSGKFNPKLEKAVRKYKNSLTSQWNSLIFEGFNFKFWVLPLLFLFLFLILSISLYNYFVFENKGFLIALFLGINAILFVLYQWLIRKPAVEKLALRAEIEGFKMYLSAAEERQLQFLNPPQLTPDRFEKLLPYAIALDVEEIWGEKFNHYLAMASSTQSTYHPIWYQGSIGNMGRFSHSLNSSLSNSFSSASSKPSSSSGGGGFSGGGGGGGGGGSW